jgi:tellurite resistance protein TerC
MAVDLWIWGALLAGIAVLLALDLLVFHRDAHRVSVREAGVLTSVWIAIALAFAGVLWWWQGGNVAAEYLTGYVVEKSLSLDNVFVFALIFAYFAVPEDLRYRVLFWGVVLAIALRGVFIVAGSTLLANFAWVAYGFGAFLVLTGIRVARHTQLEIHPERNPALRLMRRVVPVTSDFRGTRMIVREGGRRVATPLLLAFVVVATFDLVFAVDSIPAILAITTDTFVVFAANAFALLGLRSLYFLVGGAMNRLPSLNVGLGLVLAFVGVKMLVADWWKVPIWISLPVLLGLLGGTVASSALRARLASGRRRGPDGRSYHGPEQLDRAHRQGVRHRADGELEQEAVVSEELVLEEDLLGHLGRAPDEVRSA